MISRWRTNFNPRAPCGARHLLPDLLVGFSTISIHAPRAGRDNGRHNCCSNCGAFQSTRPVRGATILNHRISGFRWDFNPRAPCGARRGHALSVLRVVNFNPRAPCGARPPIVPSVQHHRQFQSTRPVRGATPRIFPLLGERLFQSTRPVRGATLPDQRKTTDTIISIHAPRAGRDPSASVSRAGRWNFNPRAPCGARLVTSTYSDAATLFQSTRPVRGATPMIPNKPVGDKISIHAPRAGRDLGSSALIPSLSRFQSTRPVRGATLISVLPFNRPAYFNPRAPCGARQ